MNQQDKDQYQHQSECQDYADYCVEGYHPVVLGEKFNQKYVIVQKLGWGHFSTVWLVHNQQTNEYAALKIQRSKQSHSQSAIDQLQILSQVRKHQSSPRWSQFLNTLSSLHTQLIKPNLCRPLLLLDNFPHYGIHGKHYCSVFQILGPNLLDLIQHYQFNQQRMPLWLVKKITIDCLLGLQYLHEYCDIIHTDLKPENIMIKLEPHQQAQLVEQIKAYKVKPISMKYLKNIQTSKNSKNKKKKLKKKNKKKQEDNQLKQQQNQDNQQSNANNQSSQATSNKQIVQQSKQPISLQQNGKPQLQQPIRQKQAEFQDKQKQKWNPLLLKWKNVKIQLNYKIFFKIVDMGNACFSNKHFTQGIQTREYRAPQVILGYGYIHNTDIWSLGCTIFQLLTNNFLFKPKKIDNIPKNQDHLYKMIQVLGPFPKQLISKGKQSNEYFNKKGKLIHGMPKQQLSLSKLLVEDYHYKQQQAKQIEEFLLPMLEYLPEKRISAKECLNKEWLWKV